MKKNAKVVKVGTVWKLEKVWANCSVRVVIEEVFENIITVSFPGWSKLHKRYTNSYFLNNYVQV